MTHKTNPKRGAPNGCYHLNASDRSQIAFDDHRLVANAGLLLPVVLARHLGLSEPVSTTKTLRRRFFSLAGRITRKARRLTLHLPQGWPWQNQFGNALERLRTLPLPS